MLVVLPDLYRNKKSSSSSRSGLAFAVFYPPDINGSFYYFGVVADRSSVFSASSADLAFFSVYEEVGEGSLRSVTSPVWRAFFRRKGSKKIRPPFSADAGGLVCDVWDKYGR